jgi:hypothetical protein
MLTPEQLLWNPNSIPAELNPLESGAELARLERDMQLPGMPEFIRWEYEILKDIHAKEAIIREAVASARAILTSYKVEKYEKRAPADANLAFGLDAELELGSKDCGLGIMLATGEAERSWHEKMHADPIDVLLRYFVNSRTKTAGLENKIRKEWPVCLETNKPMRFVGAVNAGTWPYLFHQLSKWKCDSHTFGSPYGIHSIHDEYKPSYRWYFFWTGLQNRFDQWLPDCAIAHKDIVRYNHDDAPHPDVQILGREIMARLQADSCFNEDVTASPPAGFVSNLTFKIDLDTISGKKGQEEYFAQPEDSLFQFKGGLKLFGEPRSQQTPRRPLDQNRYPWMQALSPVLSFNDDAADVTHQFYGSLREDQYSRNIYGKLDSSNT